MAAALGEAAPPAARGRAFGLAEIGAGIGDSAAPFAAGLLYNARPALTLEAALLGCGPLLVVIALVGRVAGRPKQG